MRVLCGPWPLLVPVTLVTSSRGRAQQRAAVWETGQSGGRGAPQGGGGLILRDNVGLAVMQITPAHPHCARFYSATPSRAGRRIHRSERSTAVNAARAAGCRAPDRCASMFASHSLGRRAVRPRLSAALAERRGSVLDSPANASGVSIEDLSRASPQPRRRSLSLGQYLLPPDRGSTLNSRGDAVGV
jgi:hypothetical protein